MKAFQCALAFLLLAVFSFESRADHGVCNGRYNRYTDSCNDNRGYRNYNRNPGTRYVRNSRGQYDTHSWNSYGRHSYGKTLSHTRIPGTGLAVDYQSNGRIKIHRSRSLHEDEHTHHDQDYHGGRRTSERHFYRHEATHGNYHWGH